MTSASKGLLKETIENCFANCGVVEHPACTEDKDVDKEFNNLFKELSEELQINGHIAADDTLILIKRFVHHFNT